MQRLFRKNEQKAQEVKPMSQEDTIITLLKKKFPVDYAFVSETPGSAKLTIKIPYQGHREDTYTSINEAITKALNALKVNGLEVKEERHFSQDDSNVVTLDRSQCQDLIEKLQSLPDAEPIQEIRRTFLK